MQLGLLRGVRGGSRRRVEMRVGGGQDVRIVPKVNMRYCEVSVRVGERRKGDEQSIWPRV
jgi:hypothetical protein